MAKTINNPPEDNDGVSLVVQTGLSLSSEDRFRRLIRQELFRQALGKEEAETFEEADNFDLDEDEQWVSEYENDFDPPEVSIPVEHPETPSSVTNTPPSGAGENPPPAGGNVSGQ